MTVNLTYSQRKWHNSRLQVLHQSTRHSLKKKKTFPMGDIFSLGNQAFSTAGTRWKPTLQRRGTGSTTLIYLVCVQHAARARPPPTAPDAWVLTGLIFHCWRPSRSGIAPGPTVGWLFRSRDLLFKISAMASWGSETHVRKSVVENCSFCFVPNSVL